MSNIIKLYKSLKTKQTIKSKDLIFFFHRINLNSVNNLKIEQKIFKENVSLKYIHNNSIKIAFNNSIFSNLSSLAKGFIGITFYNNYTISNNHYKKMKMLGSDMDLIYIKLNKRIYTTIQLKELTTLDYLSNINMLNKILKKSTKKFTYVLKI